MNDDEDDGVVSRGRPGIPVDAYGKATIDPTKNVLDLVRAESKYQDAMRLSLKERWDESHAALKEQIKITNDYVLLFHNSQRDAETKRIDQLAQNRQEFQNTIRDMLAESVRTTSNLVSTQLVQIQTTFDTRITKLEAGAFTQAGKSSIADPQISDAMARLARDLTEAKNTQEIFATKMTNTLALMQAQESGIGGRAKGMSDTNARMLAIVMALAAVASPVVSILVTIMVMRGR